MNHGLGTLQQGNTNSRGYGWINNILDEEERHDAAAAHLPNELVLRILLLASSSDSSTAHKLAHVSRSICKLTAPDRWHTVVISSFNQWYRLWSTILLARGRKAESELVRRAACSVNVKEEDVTWNHTPISLPSVSPGHAVKRLYISTESESDPTASATASNQRHLDLNDFQGILTHLADHLGTSARLSNDSWRSVQRFTLCAQKYDVRTSGFLHHFPNVTHLSLGAHEFASFHTSLQTAHPTHLTLFYEGDHETLRKNLTDSTCAFVRDDENGRQHVRLGGLRKRLKKLHIVAIDPRSGVGGVEFPFDILEPLRAGSVRQGSIIDARTRARSQTSEGASSTNEASEDDDGPDETSQGLTHLRYDTRRFALRPCSIIANRMRPFFQEPSFGATSGPLSRDSYSASTTEDFSYTGRRHAAPSRGAGGVNAAMLGTAVGTEEIPPAVSIWQDDFPAAETLRSWGVGSFARLHLAWEVPPNSDASLPGSTSNASSNATANGGLLAGGWPRESRDVWTDRSETLPLRLDDVDPGRIQDSFAREMQDEIWARFGWRPADLNDARRGLDGLQYALVTRHEAESSQMAAAMPMGVTEEDRNALARLREALRARDARGAAHLGHVIDTLQFGVRAPMTLVKLGGMGAFTKQQRLQLFLEAE